MIHLATAEELKPGLRLHLDGRVYVIHTPPYFWSPSENEGFVIVRDEPSRKVLPINITRRERFTIE